MYDTVYHHKTVRCAEGMVALFLRRLREVLHEGTRIEVMQLAMPLLHAVRGAALPHTEILQLDDFALSVLIDNVAQAEARDPTVRDLALRIRSRDLFKQVPLGSDVIGRYLRTDHAKDRLYEAIKPFVPGDPRFYLVHDEARFRMLADEDRQSAALISDDGEARFLKDHIRFSQYLREGHEVVRLFTVREALRAVTSVIQN